MNANQSNDPRGLPAAPVPTPINSSGGVINELRPPTAQALASDDAVRKTGPVRLWSKTFEIEGITKAQFEKILIEQSTKHKISLPGYLYD